MLNIVKKLFLISMVLALAGCSEDKNTLKVGTIAGPETELVEVAKYIAHEKYGLNIKIVEFTDYIEPNAALNDGSIDANVFQHQPFLDQQIKDRHYKLMTIGKTFVYPMGVYSLKVKNIAELKDGALVGIPNDPSNEGRALLLLQKAGLIQLSPAAGLYATPADIEKNPRHLQFKELDAAQLSRAMPDLDAAIINTNYAVPAGYSPTKDAIFLEDASSPYANVIVIRESSKDDPRMSQLVAALQSPEVVSTARRVFHDQAITAWQHQLK